MTRAHITLVVDRSGSMSSIRSEAEAGIKKFISEQAALDGVKVKVTLYQFDDVYEHSFGSVTKLVEEQKAAGWEFIFLAGTLAAVKFGQQSGLATRSFDPNRRGETVSAYAGASANTSDYLTGKAATTATPDTEGAPTA